MGKVGGDRLNMYGQTHGKDQISGMAHYTRCCHCIEISTSLATVSVFVQEIISAVSYYPSRRSQLNFVLGVF